jgi:3-hydroxyisobutyrate dehydrogenase
MEALKLGWIGLGNMGNPMTKNLLKAGFSSRIQSQQRQGKELIELGATSAASTQELMQTCDVVITMLSNDEAVKEVYESENGLLSQDNPGKLIINEYSFS